MEVSVPFPFGQRVIDPMFDIGFKLIFGRENVSEPLLVDLLNSIFVGDPLYGNIVSVSFHNTEQPGEWENGKGIRYDIRCVTADHRHFIVEMQKAEQEYFLPRCYYYVSRATATQGYRGRDRETGKSWEYELEPVVGVFFCNFHVRGLSRVPLVKGRLLDECTHEPIGDYQRYAFIQIPFFTQEEGDCNTRLEEWVYNIKNMGRMQKIAFTIEDTFRYLKEVSDVAALTPADREVYEAELMKARDYNAVMKTAERKGLAEGMSKGLAEGIATGRAKGRAEGIAAGRAEGIAEGRAEGIAEGISQVVRSMMANGLDLEAISAYTGFSIDELKALM